MSPDQTRRLLGALEMVEGSTLMRQGNQRLHFGAQACCQTPVENQMEWMLMLQHTSGLRQQSLASKQ